MEFPGLGARPIGMSRPTRHGTAVKAETHIVVILHHSAERCATDRPGPALRGAWLDVELVGRVPGRPALVDLIGKKLSTGSIIIIENQYGPTGPQPPWANPHIRGRRAAGDHRVNRRGVSGGAPGCA